MATFTINTLIDENDGLNVGNTSLRDAINAANITPEADDIFFNVNPGTITLVNGELLISQSLTINGLGVNDLTIDADNLSRVFNIDDGNSISDQTIILDGLTIANGNVVDENGGGVRSLENLVLQNSIVTGSSATSDLNSTNYTDRKGGGIYAVGSLSVIDSVVQNNQTYSASETADGGGIWGGEITITNSIVSGNKSYGGGGYGGGVFGDRVTVTNSRVEDNETRYFSVSRAFNPGGGIFANTAVITNSTVRGNKSEGYGGGIYARNATVSHSTVSDNVGYFGGGISADRVTITNSTLSGNTATVGAAVYLDSSNTLSITNSTVTLNEARSQFSGAVDTQSGSGEINNSIIAGNVGKDVAGTFSSNGANIIGDASGSTGFNNNETFAGLGINNVAEVIDPALTNNGGSTATHALVAGSVALNSGVNADAEDADGAPLAFDQRGSGFDRIIGSAVDIGAFESQAPSNAFFFSGSGDSSAGSLTFADEDIVYFDGTDFSLVFDGSDLLARNIQVAAFDMVSDTEILMVFSRPTTVPGLGTVDDSDVVKFTASSLGSVTDGDFELHLDGSDIGLDAGSEKIDALTRMDGGLLLSTTGNVNASGVTAKDQDLLLFQPNTLGNNTSGTLSLYLDGSDVGLNRSTEDLNAIATRDDQLLLSTQDKVRVPGLRGLDEDILAFTPTSTGVNSAGQFDDEFFFDGSMVGFTGDIIGLDFSI